MDADLRVPWVFCRPTPGLCTDGRKLDVQLGPSHASWQPAEAAINYRLLYSSKQVAQGQSQAVPDSDLLQNAQNNTSGGGLHTTSEHGTISSTSGTPKDHSTYQALLGTN